MANPMSKEEADYLRAVASKMDSVADAHKKLQKKCRSGTVGEVRSAGRRLIAETHRLLRTVVR